MAAWRDIYALQDDTLRATRLRGLNHLAGVLLVVTGVALAALRLAEGRRRPDAAAEPMDGV